MRYHARRNDWWVPQAGLATLRGDALRSSDTEAPPSVQRALGRSGHLVHVGDFDRPECPTGSGCTGPCGEAANAKAWARFIACSAGA
jgi:hypothetical protein